MDHKRSNRKTVFTIPLIDMPCPFDNIKIVINDNPQNIANTINFTIFFICFFRENECVNNKYPLDKKNKGTHGERMVLKK